MYNRRRPLIVAAVISLLLHVALFVGVHRDAVELPEPVPRVLEARLLPAPLSPIVMSENKLPEKTTSKPIKPRTKPSAVKHEVISSAPQEALTSTETAQTVPAENIASVQSTSAVEALPIPAPAAVPEEITPQAVQLPSRLLIRFAVYLGDLKAGEAEYRWEQSGGRYDLQSFVKTTGLVGFLKSLWLMQTSVGEITPQGLRPETFVNQRSDKPSESAMFDWPNGSLKLLSGGVESGTVALLPGAQDLMSVLFQFAFSPPSSGDVQLAVVTGRKLETYRFSVVGEETLHVPLGDMQTVHVRRPKTENDDGLDVWLAIDRNYLPIRIIRADRKDSRPVELVAAELLTTATETVKD